MKTLIRRVFRENTFMLTVKKAHITRGLAIRIQWIHSNLVAIKLAFHFKHGKLAIKAIEILIHAKTQYGGGTPTLFNFESRNTLLSRERTAVESRENRRESRENRRESRGEPSRDREENHRESRGEPSRDREDNRRESREHRRDIERILERTVERAPSREHRRESTVEISRFRDRRENREIKREEERSIEKRDRERRDPTRKVFLVPKSILPYPFFSAIRDTARVSLGRHRKTLN
ncbi:hypothetical protein DY000_02047209 [Brassica cretica]|uniref:Uncharacterized protein n=1 Tax=Brassica cretica TaxID=69181 RepID=A0ABQ7EWM8_BRACR|nr:hypothetical protein DY000_02047209 [Brassica cretica]